MNKILKKYFGYESFRPLQKEIINNVLAKKDTLVLMPTGGGKSLCYQLPALILPGITIVISPLIALMKDQVDSLKANGISAEFLNSSLTQVEQNNVIQKAIEGELKILYLAPERLNSFGFDNFLKKLNINLLAIDEAHCISEWGHDFRPEYRKLNILKNKISAPTIALTATATEKVKIDILEQLNMETHQVFISSFNRENLHYSVRPKLNTFSHLVKILNNHKGESVIIYCFSRKDTENLVSKLQNIGVKALSYHAGMKKDERRSTQEKFIRDEVTVIVATIAFGMGIDKSDVRLVVHMDLPKSIENYYQETGRAGRDGVLSECILFYSYADKRKQEFFIDQISDEKEQNISLKKLNQVVEYCQLNKCRRKYLLDYFGENTSDLKCEACDVCVVSNVENFDATIIAQKIMSAILKTGERFGSAHICDVLRGSRRKKILDLGHNNLSVYGIVKDVSVSTLRSYISSLHRMGYITQSMGDYPTLQVTQKGKKVLLNNETVMLPIVDEIKQVSKRQKISNLDFDQRIFEKLRILRKNIADKEQVPPFVIFGDKTLFELAYYLPSTLESMREIFGVGQKKLESFGEEFLNCIKESCKEFNLKEKAIQKKDINSQKKNKSSNTLQTTKKMIGEKIALEDIAIERQLSVGTIIQHLEKLKDLDQLPDVLYLRFNEEKFQKIKTAFINVESQFLTPVFKYLKEEYSYDDLRLVRLFL